jgi:hypothetical protein
MPPDQTFREEEILVPVARGRTNSEIAAELHISISTVKAHLAALVRKLGAGTASSSPSGPTRPAASRTDLELAALEHTTWIVPGCNAVSSSRARPSSYVGRHLEFGTQPTNHGRSTQASTRSRCVPP